MPMNLVIQQRRRELGLTQEQLARALNVTAPAVNKWEKGATCPDVSLLPPLARLLKIDLNELFCFREDLTQEEVQRFAAEVLQVAQAEGLDAGFALAEEKLREYPRCDALLHQCTIALEGARMLCAEAGDAGESREAQLDAWYERCAACGDEDIRRRATFMLAGRYLRREDDASAQHMLDQLSDEPAVDKRLLQCRLHLRRGERDAAGRLAARALLMSVNEAQSFLWMLMDVEHDCGNDALVAEMAQCSVQLTHLFGLWDYNAAVAPLSVALENRDAPEALRLLEQLLDASQQPWRPEDTLLFRRLAEGLSRPDMRRMLPPLVRGLENDPACDFLRGEPGFAKLLARSHALLDDEA